MATKNPQLKLLKSDKKFFGGSKFTTRKERARTRPLSTKDTMHLVLRSEKAKGDWSFRRGSNPSRIRKILVKFSTKYGVRLLSVANVGNHIHMQLKLTNRYGYRPFIRATTAAIAMAITGRNRWTAKGEKIKFWDFRPYSRVAVGLKGFLYMRDYIRVNQLEGEGCTREEARYLIAEFDRRRGRVNSS